MKTKHLFSMVLCLLFAFSLQAQDLSSTPSDDEVVVKTVREGSGPNVEEGQDVEVHIVLSDAEGKVLRDTRKMGFPMHDVVGKDDDKGAQVFYDILKGANKGGIYEADVPKSKLEKDDPAQELPGDHISVRVMVIDYGPAAPNGTDVIRSTIKEDGLDAANAVFKKVQADEEDDHRFYQWDMNRLGYDLLGEKNTDAAVAVFKMNTDLFPASANAYDSLGDGYMAAGDKDNAAMCFETALELNPDFEASANKLQKIRGEEGGEKK